MAVAKDIVTRLFHDVRSGALAAGCDDLDLDILVLFGSAVSDPAEARDVDLAYGRRRDRTPVGHLHVVDVLGVRYGDGIDVLDLDAAGPVARFEALHRGVVLVERTPGRYANAQMAAFGAFCDTQRLRDRALEVLAG